MAASKSVCFVTPIAVLSSLLKLGYAKRNYHLQIHGPLWLYLCGWIGALALPGPAFQILSNEGQHVFCYIVAWIVAVFVALHLPLVTWQGRKGFASGDGICAGWLAPWIIMGVLGAVTVGQLFSVMYVFADYTLWFFTPILLAACVVVICLAMVRGTFARSAWGLLVLAVWYMVLTSIDTLPKDFPTDMLAGIPDGISQYVLHPIYPPVIFLAVLQGIVWLMLRRWWLLLVALMAPTAGGTFLTMRFLLRIRNGKGVALLLAAFILLGVGAALQWCQERWGKKLPDYELEECSLDG